MLARPAERKLVKLAKACFPRPRAEQPFGRGNGSHSGDPGCRPDRRFRISALAAQPHSRDQASLPERARSADLECDLASGVPGRDPRQRLAGPVERQDRFGLRAEFAGIDKGSQLLKPCPAAVGSE
jgi:hypothetical protein